MENKKPRESAEPLWRRFEVITDNKEQLKRAEDLLERKKIGRYGLALILATFCINPLMSEAHLQILLKGGAEMENIDESRLKRILASIDGLSSFQWGLIKQHIDFVHSSKASKNTLDVVHEEHLLANLKRAFNLL